MTDPYRPRDLAPCWEYRNEGNTHKELVVATDLTVPCKACNRPLPFVWRRNKPRGDTSIFCEPCVREPIDFYLVYPFLTMTPIRTRVRLRAHVTLETFCGYDSELADFRSFKFFHADGSRAEEDYLIRRGDVFTLKIRNRRKRTNYLCHASGRNAWKELPKRLRVHAERFSFANKNVACFVPCLEMLDTAETLQTLVEMDRMEREHFLAFDYFCEALLGLKSNVVGVFRMCDLVYVVDRFYFLPFKYKVTSRGYPEEALERLFAEILRATTNETLKKAVQEQQKIAGSVGLSQVQKNSREMRDNIERQMQELRDELKRSSGQIVETDYVDGKRKAFFDIGREDEDVKKRKKQ